MMARIARRLGGGHGEDGEPCADDDACHALRDAKIGLIFALGFVTFISSTAPWLFTRVFKRRALDVMHCCSALAAGVVFGAFMSHMVPKGLAAFEGYLAEEYEDDPENPIIEYPFSQMIIGAVVIVLIAVDRLLITHGVHGDGDSHSHDHISQAFTAMQAAEAEKKAAPGSAVLALRSVPEPAAAGTGGAPGDVAVVVPIDPAAKPPSDAAAHSDYGTVAAAALHTAEAHGHSHGTMSDPKAVQRAAHKDAIMRALVFTAAISIHSVMDGLAVGALSSPESFYSIVAAVVAHKVFDGVALGVPIFLAQMSKAAAIGALVFTALMTPLGIAIGLGATESADKHSRELAEAIIVSISAGSFLFISIVELLPSALSDGRWNKLKMSLFGLGWLAMVLLAIWV